MPPRKHVEITIPVPWSQTPVRVAFFSLGAVMAVGGLALIGLAVARIWPT